MCDRNSQPYSRSKYALKPTVIEKFERFAALPPDVRKVYDLPLVALILWGCAPDPGTAPENLGQRARRGKAAAAHQAAEPQEERVSRS
jgi:hypothetical protein